MALLHYSFPPVIGGVERVMADQAAVLVEMGHSVTLIGGNAATADSHLAGRATTLPLLSGSHPEVIAAHAELQRGAPGEEFARVRAYLEAELGTIFAEQDVVLLHNVCTMPFNLPLVSALAKMPARLPGIRLVGWVHDLAAVNPDYHIPAGDPWDLLRTKLPGFEYVAVSSLRQAEWCTLTGDSPLECPVIPNGCDTAQVLDLSPMGEDLVKQGVLERELVLLHPCRLLPRKNVEASLRITAELRAAGTDALLLVTGAADPHHAPNAQYASEMIRQREALGLQEHAWFLGDLAPVTDRDMASLYQIADALLLPSKQEGFGLPMLEAAIHRLPAFCSDIEPLRSLPGAIPFSLDLGPKDISALIIRRMQQWLANSPRKAAMRNFTWRAIYRNYLAPYLLPKNNHPH